MKDLALRTDVNWHPVKLAFDEWSYKQEGLTPAGAALLAAAVAWATGGMGAELVGGTTTTTVGGVTTPRPRWAATWPMRRSQALPARRLSPWSTTKAMWARRHFHHQGQNGAANVVGTRYTVTNAKGESFTLRDAARSTDQSGPVWTIDVPKSMLPTNYKGAPEIKFGKSNNVIFA